MFIFTENSILIIRPTTKIDFTASFVVRQTQICEIRNVKIQ